MNNNDMIIVYLAGFMRLIRGSLCTWYTIFSSRSRAYIIVFMVTFCDDSFLIVFIQTEEDTVVYGRKKVVLKNCQYLYNIRRARSVFLNSVFNNNMFFYVISVQALLIKSNVLWPNVVSCGRKTLREKIWLLNVQRKTKPFFLRKFRYKNNYLIFLTE